MFANAKPKFPTVAVWLADAAWSPVTEPVASWWIVVLDESPTAPAFPVEIAATPPPLAPFAAATVVVGASGCSMVNSASTMPRTSSAVASALGSPAIPKPVLAMAAPKLTTTARCVIWSVPSSDAVPIATCTMVVWVASPTAVALPLLIEDESGGPHDTATALPSGAMPDSCPTARLAPVLPTPTPTLVTAAVWSVCSGASSRCTTCVTAVDPPSPVTDASPVEISDTPPPPEPAVATSAPLFAAARPMFTISASCVMTMCAACVATAVACCTIASWLAPPVAAASPLVTAAAGSPPEPELPVGPVSPTAVFTPVFATPVWELSTVVS